MLQRSVEITTKTELNFDYTLESLQPGKPLSGKNGILTPLIKQQMEAALTAELEAHIESEEACNRKNGRSTKTINPTSGSFELATPRNRTGSFEPQLIRKHQTHLTDEIERKVLSFYALGPATGIYPVMCKSFTASTYPVTRSMLSPTRLSPKLKEWQQRPLENHYPFVWQDAINYKVRNPVVWQLNHLYSTGVEAGWHQRDIGILFVRR